MIHAFFSERQVSKLPEIDGNAPRQILEIGVIGGGAMGVGIAVSALLAGLGIPLVERDAKAATQALETVPKLLAVSVKRCKRSKCKLGGSVAKFSKQLLGATASQTEL